MYICMCNPFTDGDVNKYLALRKGRKTTVAQTYRACSGGESPQCCTCLCSLQAMVREHNGQVTVRAMEEELAAEPASLKETA